MKGLYIAAALSGLIAVPAATAVSMAGKTNASFEQRMRQDAPKGMKKRLDSLNMSDEESEAMRFLYAYMSLADMCDRTPQFYLENVRTSIRARNEMPWGRKVPEREWRHFVLPVRVNNENLDMSRPEFYAELKERVRGMSMSDAILEVNHWCHEKVTYKPSDARTSSPLSSVSQAIGRCGEESTFAVAALRSVGIPARQVYTPRWAHTDDNHAWVEAWADGKWHFIGACEPEPVLDLAWFNAPASRGMLMNTNVIGEYDGPEEVLEQLPLMTAINVTSNYAPVHEIKAVAVDKDGKPAEGAKVGFGIYNYSEYYPVASRVSDHNGNVSLQAGLGDVVLWATDGKRFGVAKASPSDTLPVKVAMNRDDRSSFIFEYDLVPPSGGTRLPQVTDEMRRENNRRLAREDSIRNAYVATFCTPEQAVAIARRLGVDQEKLTKVLVESRGNHERLVSMLESLAPEERVVAVDMLCAVSEKDKRDISVEVVVDHLRHTAGAEKYEMGLERIYVENVLNPRIENEGLTPYREYLSQELMKIPESERADAASLAAWTLRNISRQDMDTRPYLRMSPASVWGGRRANRISRDVFFVAAARTLGFATRYDPVTGHAQWLDENNCWIDAGLDGETSSDMKPGAVMATLRLDFTPGKYVVDPRYYSSFSLSKIEGGTPRQLEYPEDATWSNTFAEGIALTPGQYMLTTGQRLADGSVLARSEVFALAPGEARNVPLILRSDDTALQVIGSLDAETVYHDLGTGADKSILSTTGRGYYVLGLISPGHEPSAHALNDISAVAEQLDGTGRKILLLFADDDEATRFDKAHFRELPECVVFGIDKDGRVRRQIEDSLHLESPENPIFVLADSFNRVVHVTTGYSIGLGETMLKNLRSVSD